VCWVVLFYDSRLTWPHSNTFNCCYVSFIGPGYQARLYKLLLPAWACDCFQISMPYNCPGWPSLVLSLFCHITGFSLLLFGMSVRHEMFNVQNRCKNAPVSLTMSASYISSHRSSDEQLDWSFEFTVCKSVHHHTIQINQPTRCNNFSSLLLDVYLQLNMFRASSRPSSGAQQLQ